MTDPSHIAEARKKVSRPQIREAFLRNGAVIPADRDDLPDYVYESVFELMELAAPAVQGEPLRYTNDGALAECPCCGSIDVGGAHDTVSCYNCDLNVTKPRPLQNAIAAWNTRAGRSATAPAVQGEPVTHLDDLAVVWDLNADELYEEGRNDRADAFQECAAEVRQYAAPQPAEQQPTISNELPARTTFGGPQRFTTAEQQADPFRGDNVALIRSAQSLLSLDDKGAFGPNGIGGHARNIITAFITRISAEQQPAPDVITTAMLEAIWKDGFDSENYDDRAYSQPLIIARIAVEEAHPAPDVDVLVEALEEISDPVRFMEERLEEGERLNGMAAVQLAGDASYLRGIAIAALAAHRKGSES